MLERMYTKKCTEMHFFYKYMYETSRDKAT
jgi:hypothetical protein